MYTKPGTELTYLYQSKKLNLLMRFSYFKNVFIFILFLLPSLVIAQSGVNTNGSNGTAIPTAVPFLNISPDSRSGAMGDAGVALSPDVNANFWNPSKLTFLEDKNAE